MFDQTTLEGKVITAAFDLAASPGWDQVSLRDIADAAGCSLADVMEKFRDKSDVISVFMEHVDKAMLAKAGEIEREQSSRDSVFEVIMSRFDAMAPYKSGLKSIIGRQPTGLVPDPGQACRMIATQNRILQAAGINATGGPALLRQIGLARIYDQVFRIWLDDDDAGMARTMAALDRRLRQGERSLLAVEDVLRSSERMCGQATDFASRLFGILRPKSGASASEDDGSGGQPSTQTTASNGLGDVPPGTSPAV